MKRDIIRVFIPNLVKIFTTIMTTFFIPRMLLIDEYGYIKLFQLYASYIGISSLGYCDGIFIRYGGYKREDIGDNEFVDSQFTLALYQFILTVIIAGLALVKGDFVLVMFGLSFLPNVMLTYYLTLSQALGMFKEYARIYNTHSLLTLAMDFCFLFILKIDRGYAFIGITVVVNYVVIVFTAIMLNRGCKIYPPRFRRSFLKENMQMGILIMGGNMAYVVYAGIDKWFIKLNLGLTSFSHYAFAAQLLAIVNMFTNPIAYTLFSYFSREKSKGFEYRMKQNMMAWLFFILPGVYVLKVVIRWFLPQYISVIPVIVILFYGQVFYSLNNSIYTNLFKVYKKQNDYFLKLVFVIVISVIMNFIFFFGIQRSMLSCAIATALCMIIWALVNLKSFAYLRLKRRNMFFALCMSGVYFGLNVIDNAIAATMVYLGVYIVMLQCCMPQVMGELTGQIRGRLSKR